MLDQVGQQSSCDFARLTLAVVTLALSACSDEATSKDTRGEGDGGPNTGGASAGGSSSGGTLGTGSGGATSGGGSGSGGRTSSSGGANPGGTGGAAPGAGGTTSDAGPSPGPKRSAGCGTASPPSGTLSFPVSGQDGEYVLSIPSNYDPGTAYPLGFAFHGRNRTGPNCHDGDCIGFQSVMEDSAVLVYMTSLGGTGWEGNGERELNVEFFETLLAHLTATYCIDENTVFVAGTSSGAHFANVLGCRFGDKLLATAPVAGYLPERDDCVGEVAALVIHGVDDPSFSGGEVARDFYVGRNGCGTPPSPPIADIHASVVQTRESHECTAYPGCDPGKPVVWCEHSEGGYDGSTHGWPAFGGQEIWDFVQAL